MVKDLSLGRERDGCNVRTRGLQSPWERGEREGHMVGGIMALPELLTGPAPGPELLDVKVKSTLSWGHPSA